jgi:hypothetical protein
MFVEETCGRVVAAAGRDPSEFGMASTPGVGDPCVEGTFGLVRCILRRKVGQKRGRAWAVVAKTRPWNA